MDLPGLTTAKAASPSTTALIGCTSCRRMPVRVPPDISSFARWRLLLLQLIQRDGFCLVYLGFSRFGVAGEPYLVHDLEEDLNVLPWENQRYGFFHAPHWDPPLMNVWSAPHGPQASSRISRSLAPTEPSQSRFAKQAAGGGGHGPQLTKRMSRSIAPTLPSLSRFAIRGGRLGQDALMPSSSRTRPPIGK